MSDRYREENDRILLSAIRRYAQEEIGGIPSADELKEIQFSEDYCARREAILRCGGRPEQAEGGLWYADDSITSRNDAILREAFAAYCEEDNRVPSGEALENVAFSQAYQKRKKQILRAKGRPVDLRVVHSRKTRRILRVGIVAALIAVIAMSSVFSNMKTILASLNLLRRRTASRCLIRMNTWSSRMAPGFFRSNMRHPISRRITHWRVISVMEEKAISTAKTTPSCFGRAVISPLTRATRVLR